MRHRKRGRKLNRTAAHRRALLRSLTCHLFRSFGARGYIVTTAEKAKTCRGFAEGLITLAKKGDLASRRLAVARLGGDKGIAKKLFDEIAPAYSERPGGYTRILRTSRRRLGDAAREVLFGFTPAADSGGDSEE
ncbi:MAG: 50S ribosomal protein L17 [Planctomycetes bacterium]|nr:50S ribosomal protein L17 [Planctomycetota bacterium]